MRCLFDQNISYRILKHLPSSFSESTTVSKERLLNKLDVEIWEFSKKNNYVIVTFDSDFNDLSSLFGFPPKVIWIRSGNLDTETISELLVKNESEIS